MLGYSVDYTKRIYGLDLLRALAILFVVHGHSRTLLSGSIFEGLPWFPLPHGVDIFFILSGFLIGYSFISLSDKKENVVKWEDGFNFWMRSAFRILPNYFLLLSVNYILVAQQILPGNTTNFSLWYFGTFTQNLFTPFYDFFWESWSLAVQEWFYLLFPLLLIIWCRFFTVRWGVLIIATGFISYAFIYRFSLCNSTYDSFWWDVTFRKTTSTRIDTIFYGVLAAYVRFYHSSFWKKNALPLLIIGLAGFTIATFIPRPMNSLYRNVFYLGLSPFFITLWLPFFDKIKDFKTIVGKLVTLISVLSYGVYLLNLLIIQLIVKHFPPYSPNNGLKKYILYYCLVFGGALLLYLAFETPIAKAGNKYFHTKRMMFKRSK